VNETTTSASTKEQRDPSKETSGHPGADPWAAGACSVRLPASSVEPVYGLSPDVQVANSRDHYSGVARPAPRHRRDGITIVQLGRASLPVRVPGQHLLHARLRRSSRDGRCGRVGSSA
jgi:hypothetical protein